MEYIKSWHIILRGKKTWDAYQKHPNQGDYKSSRNKNGTDYIKRFPRIMGSPEAPACSKETDNCHCNMNNKHFDSNTPIRENELDGFLNI